MSRSRKNSLEPGVLEILEEAVELLRRAPLSALAAYYFGSVPFCLGILYFWADMSRSADAVDILSQDAFGLALFFIWMKTWQTYHSRILWAHLSREPEPQWTFARMARAALTQAVYQPWGILAVPIGGIFVIPVAWVYTFFQNLTVLGDGSGESLRQLYRKSWRLSGLWPRQNHVTLMGLFFFGFFIFVNLVVTLLLGSQALKTFLGIETMFSRSLASLFNSTLLAILCVLTYLCVDPVIKAVFTLRCFYAESLGKGEDLKAELKSVVPLSKTLLLLILLGGASAAWAQTPSAPDTARVPSVNSAELEQTITATLRNDEYRWHLPRETAKVETQESEPGFIVKFLEGSIRYLFKGIKTAVRWIGKLFDWIGKYFKPEISKDRQVKSNDWNFAWLYGFLWILLGAALCALTLLIYRLWRRQEGPVVLVRADRPLPDVRDERVTGVELPMDGWLEMARDLFQQGHYRLALRAYYLASIVCLARQKFLTIAKFKSTMDYERELNRRAHSLPQLLTAFSESGRLFDRGWYGDGEVTQGMVESFVSFHQKIETLAEPGTVST